MKNLIPLFKKWIRKFPENKLELMEYYSFILFEKWLYMDSLDNISEANKIYYEIKAIADELSKDYADNQVTQMLSMGIVRNCSLKNHNACGNKEDIKFIKSIEMAMTGTNKVP